MGIDTRSPEDPAVAALRQVADINTVRSIKQTFLACLLIRSVVRPPTARVRRFITTTALSAMGLAIAHWHIWSVLIHLLH
jgi:hypothetical protein